MVSPQYKRGKLRPNWQTPYCTAAASAAPRGGAWRRSAIHVHRKAEARTRRRQAAQRGGKAALPKRMTRKVLPQMAQQPAKAAMRDVEETFCGADMERIMAWRGKGDAGPGTHLPALER